MLADPSRHIGRSYRPTGPELISPHDVAGILSKVVGRKVTYQDTAFALTSKAAVALGYPTYASCWARHFYEELRRGAFAIGAPTDHVEEVCGRRPEDFETIARRYVAQPELIWPGLKVGTKLYGLRVVLKMIFSPAPNLDRWEREHCLPVLAASPQLAHESEEWRESAAAQRLLLLPLDSAHPAGRRAAGAQVERLGARTGRTESA